jgi:hypothetical protein
VDHQVVVLAAANGSGRSAGARAGHDLDQLEVDQATAAGRLVHGRGTEPSQLTTQRGIDGHS